jgi:hypothetical protein
MKPLILAAAVCLVCACSRDGSSVPHAQAPAAAPTQAPLPAPPASPAPGAADFTDDIRLLYRVLACGGDDALPPNLDAATVNDYCKWLRPRLATYETAYLAKARPFLAAHRPAGLPTTVVYPFGGGDLLSALLTYPDGLEFTTLSLEHAGDPRRLKKLDQTRLALNLGEIRRRIAGLFTYAESTSENMMQLEKRDVPGQLAFFVVALAAHGYEPVSLRYFRLEPGGGIRYLSAEDIARGEKTKAQRLNKVWVSPDFSASFSNSELVFKPVGKKGPLKVHRHLAVNLSDDNLRNDPSVLAHLEAKGRICAMTKAASYLLWADGFSRIRNYLLGHMAYMFSDSTGIPPSDAARAGFEMETYGRFRGPFLAAKVQVADAFRKLWAGQPYRELDFRYGYPDATGQNHLLITRPVAKEAQKPTEAPARP